MVRKSSSDEDVMSNIGKSKPKEKKEEKRTFVFEIELTEYTNDSYAEYNWKKLVQREEDKDNDSDIEIIEITDGGKGQQKKRTKPVDPEDEYDLNDDFIDDSEVNDEEVPEDVSTAHGGFYVNTGSLKFKMKSSILDQGQKQRSNGSSF